MEDEEREVGSGLFSLYNDDDNEAFTEEEDYGEEMEGDSSPIVNEIDHVLSPSEESEEESGLGG